MSEQIERFHLGDGSGAMVVYADDCDNLLAEVETLRKDAKRYRWLRKLDPNKFGKIWQKNITTGIPFDTLVDEAIEQKHA